MNFSNRSFIKFFNQSLNELYNSFQKNKHERFNEIKESKEDSQKANSDVFFLDSEFLFIESINLDSEKEDFMNSNSLMHFFSDRKNFKFIGLELFNFDFDFNLEECYIFNEKILYMIAYELFIVFDKKNNLKLYLSIIDELFDSNYMLFERLNNYLNYFELS